MDFAVQRRHILLAPPDEAEATWICEQADREDIWQAFGYDEPGGDRLRQAIASGNVICGLIRRDDGRRVGFSCLYPPTDELLFWEYIYAIPAARDRDAFSAIYANDAMCFYAFDWLMVDSIGWRLYPDNRAARAIVERMGFAPLDGPAGEALGCELYALGREQWSARQTKIETRESTHPSGLGSAFVRVVGPPYKPRRPVTAMQRVFRG